MKRFVLSAGTLAAFALFGLQASAATSHLTGKVTGIDARDGDGFVDGALVLPSVKAEAILRFDIQNLLAPKEPMTAGPKTVSVPGNLYFPSQSEDYVFFPITLSKPTFSFFPEVGAKDELYALTFRVPFDDLLKMGESNGAFTDIIPMIQLKNFAFEGARDWSVEKSTSLPANKQFAKTLEYRWQRVKNPANTADLAVAFQRTPAGRWMVTDLVGKPAASGKLASAAGMQPEMKVLLLRLTNQDRTPISAVGHIRTAAANGKLEANELPPALTASVKKGTPSVISWTPVTSPGWMAVLRTKKAPTFDLPLPRAFETSGDEAACSFAAAIDTLFGSGNSCESDALDFGTPLDLGTSLEAWVAGSAGKFELATPLAAGESLTLIFVGSDKEVPSPAEATADGEPQLFVRATELRMIRL